jgi:predicted nucleic acid-binding protein
MKILLDTSVLIDVLRGRNNRRNLLANLLRDGHSLTTSVLNVAEVYAGMRPGEEAQTAEFLNGLDCLELNESGACMAGHLKNSWAQKGRTLTLADTIVAAIAIEHCCTLFTDNRKDFSMPEIQLYQA